ncbi:MAG TPA: FAD-binding protein [Syntrophomonadaceae bacterium]|nr:FAD-binding protein [Syntrophomonadaceae bacterium]
MRKIRVRGLRLPLEHEEQDIIEKAAQRIGVTVEDIHGFSKVRKAVDARRREIFITYTVDIDLADDVQLAAGCLESPDVTIVPLKPTPVLKPGDQVLPIAPVIVGSGPAGLFCGLLLARQGYNPVIIEKGLDMDRRIAAVESFWSQGKLDPITNPQFGEGGAGTFSDGKLTTRIGDQRVDYVLEAFVEYGAPEEIRYLKKPHVGTDIIRQVVKKIRQEILDLGGEFYFNACLTDVSINKMSIQSIVINNRVEIPCAVLVLATGHSARDVYRLLKEREVQLIPKAFAVGLRVEHPQEWIDKVQYGTYAGHSLLGAADYHLTYQDKALGRSVYTFCMCPGGYVVATASEPGQVVTNGMSYYARDSGVGNSALVVTLFPEDWGKTTLGGMEFQQELEEKAFRMGGGNYRAPAQRLVDFMAHQYNDEADYTLATYKPGITPANLGELLPHPLGQVMERGIQYWHRRMAGFIHERAVLTGIETRTSAPVRIERVSQLHSVNVNNLYPCGEGAGYAGGIVSAAVDGLKVAEQIMATYQPPEQKPLINDESIIKGRELTRVK